MAAPAPALSRTVVVVEDEAPIAEAVATRLRSEGFRVEIAADGPTGVELCAALQPDVVVLDLMLPGFDGLEVCRRIQRDRAVPVLMLTARDSETDLVVGLAVGADDYLTKPFSTRELVARVHALVRRAERGRVERAEVRRIGDVTLDVPSRRVRSGARLVHLTPTEFDLLAHLASRPARVFTRDQLLAAVWGYEDGSGARTVDSHVRALRRKLGNDVVRTVHGVGYAAGGTAASRHIRRDRLARPLDDVPSIKLKLGFVIAAAVAMTVFVFWVGLHLGLWPSVSGVLAAAVAMTMVFFLSRGMTSPLREMSQAATEMAKGNYDRRVRSTSRDEVGELARAFNQMAAELAETDRVRRDLVANVSHELRTPITALQAALENLVDGVATPDPETFRTMLAQVERLGRLVRQLLDLSRLESGAVPLERTTFDVEPLLEHAVREQRLHAPEVAVSVSVSDPTLRADGDPERVHQVVANLLENAVRHSPHGGTVEVRARRTSVGVVIEVLDEGPGIPEEARPRVFERFYRADSARAAQDGGAGLGLAIARWIVDLHGGDIRPERREPHGCRMVVTLPPAKEHA